MFSILPSPYDLTTTATILIELKYTFYLKQANIRRTFPTVVFAARIVVDDHTSLLTSVDEACLKRIGEAVRFTDYSRCDLRNYEVERFLVWNGLEDGKLPLAGLSEVDFGTQWELVERRGWMDRLRVHMAFEVDLDGDEGREEQESEAEEEAEEGEAQDSEESQTVVGDLGEESMSVVSLNE
ncbi:hypothetical protein DL546_003772 [Coniochaeta pulveracea]|uniref:Uncharacterized protein n=1 Tax=Coniochaeta pulveracea TaxID=177199 RepID=A0A420YIM1_9PEZI|nr:hypothetical protein DL546_003772 [Coniochaeta pulveracea]